MTDAKDIRALRYIANYGRLPDGFALVEYYLDFGWIEYSKDGKLFVTERGHRHLRACEQKLRKEEDEY